MGFGRGAPQQKSPFRQQLFRLPGSENQRARCPPAWQQQQQQQEDQISSLLLLRRKEPAHKNVCRLSSFTAAQV